MILRGRVRDNKMPCESCAVQFSVFRRKRVCCECERYYCSGCLRRGGGAMCAPCRVLSTRPLFRHTIAHLKARDLQCFLQRQNVSTRGCVEKEELVSLCVSHVNSAAYRRRGSRGGSSPFSSLKGLTNNINDFINSAFDLRAQPQPAPPPPSRSCYNTSHSHEPSADAGPAPAPQSRTRPTERFTTTPGGERDIIVPPPEPAPTPRRSDSLESAHVDSADCFEIEDLDDQGWEVVNRPAEPLPNDSEVLMSATEGGVQRAPEPELEREPHRELQRELQRELHRELHRESRREPAQALEDDSLSPPESPDASPRGPQRAASELELRRSESAATDTASLQDEPIMSRDPETPRHISLQQFKHMSELEALNVKQLKELLTRNRVEFRGCIERADLLERANTLWRDHARYRDELENLPLEECCKICMAAPLECVLLECGHIAACTACAKQLAECPICRQYVVRAVRFFRS
ncbi:E3 ubiquitin-protein ligase rififylin [Manduca sexta]|uniref:RING-type domain-containing protein n=1 Tax=Manduca sexta TaxID=7130 RepID=A0A921ZHU9_MANSE|nr:E3 ubiquitin-protein ligase rififylin [Manduca sexta]KAG6457269.1 hypothetical protein O3G_MSEX010193 [Manduca sexta]